MSKWVLDTGPELIEVPLHPKLYKRLLADIAAVLIDSYSQLPRIENLKSQPIGNQESPATKAVVERIGSNEKS